MKLNALLTIAGYRLSRFACNMRARPLAYLLKEFFAFITKNEIDYRAEIGPGLRLPHATGIVIGRGVVIGSGVSIGQSVTIGGNWGRRTSDGATYPRIGDSVWIAAGSIIAGPVTVGDRSLIGCLSNVMIDVPPDSVAYGNPAAVKRSTTEADRRKLLRNSSE